MSLHKDIKKQAYTGSPVRDRTAAQAESISASLLLVTQACIQSMTQACTDLYYCIQVCCKLLISSLPLKKNECKLIALPQAWKAFLHCASPYGTVQSTVESAQLIY